MARPVEAFARLVERARIPASPLWWLVRRNRYLDGVAAEWRRRSSP